MADQRRGRASFVGTLGSADGAGEWMLARGLALLSAAKLVVHDAACGALVGAGSAPDAGRRALASGSVDEVVGAIVDGVNAGLDVVRLIDGDVVVAPSARVLDELAALARAGLVVELVPTVSPWAAAAARAGMALPPGARVHVDGATIELAAPSAPASPASVLPWPPRRGARSSEDPSSGAQGVAVGGDVVVEGARRVALGEDAPLFGRSVLVTRAREQASSTARLLRARGALPIELPTIVIGPPDDPSALDAAARALRTYTHVLFTSTNGVSALFDALDRVGLDARAFGAAHVAAIGPGTARELERRGVRPDSMPEEHRGEALAELLLGSIAPTERSSARVLLARAAVARDALPSMLSSAGVHVDVVHAYRTRAPDVAAVEQLRKTLQARRLDVAIFTASSTVTQLCELVVDAPALLEGVTIASIGPITSDAARARGLHVDVEANPYTIDALVEALERHFARP